MPRATPLSLRSLSLARRRCLSHVFFKRRLTSKALVDVPHVGLPGEEHLNRSAFRNMQQRSVDSIEETRRIINDEAHLHKWIVL